MSIAYTLWNSYIIMITTVISLDLLLIIIYHCKLIPYFPKNQPRSAFLAKVYT